MSCSWTQHGDPCGDGTPDLSIRSTTRPWRSLNRLVSLNVNETVRRISFPMSLLSLLSWKFQFSGAVLNILAVLSSVNINDVSETNMIDGGKDN